MNEFALALEELLHTLPESYLCRIESLGQVRQSRCCLLKLQPGWAYADGSAPDVPLFCPSLEAAVQEVMQARRKR